MGFCFTAKMGVSLQPFKDQTNNNNPTKNADVKPETATCSLTLAGFWGPEVNVTRANGSCQEMGSRMVGWSGHGLLLVTATCPIL